MNSDLLADRIRVALADLPVNEKRMFGGICFMLSGHMAVCSSNRGLLVRVGKEGHASALAEPHARPMEMRGRPLEGYVFVDATGIESDDEFRRWLERALSYVATLPPKVEGKRVEAKRRRKQA